MPRIDANLSLSVKTGPSLRGSNCEKQYDSSILILDDESLGLLTSEATGVQCQRCGWRKVETWTVAAGSEDISGITFFRCISCGHTWHISDGG